VSTVVSLQELEGCDPGGMFGCVAAWGQRAAVADARAREALAAWAHDRTDSILIAGMGGSAISADVASEFLAGRWGVRMAVHRGPGLPAWVDARTHVVALSYSGDTGETLSAVDEALARGCPVVGLTCGGQLARRLAATGRILTLEPGWQPRAAMGEILFSLLALLAHWGAPVDPGPALAHAAAFGDALADGVRDDHPALGLARFLSASTDAWPVVVGVGGTTGALVARLRGQLAENAKCLATSTVLPEGTHNDLVSLALDRDRAAVLVAYRDPEEAAWLALQADAALAVADRPVFTVRPTHPDPLARLVEGVLIGDLASVLLAWLRRVDPSPIAPIVALKSRMQAL